MRSSVDIDGSFDMDERERGAMKTSEKDVRQDPPERTSGRPQPRPLFGVGTGIS
jgi:hypothetical protein